MNETSIEFPEEIAQLVERCITHVKKRYAIELDFSSETLSILDFFVNDLVKDENGGEVPLPGHPSRMNMVHLFAPTLGAYFGAMITRQFGGRFRHTDKDITAWRVEFDTLFLRFNPVAVAAGAIAQKEVDGLDTILRSSPVLMPKLQERFDVAPEVPEDEFFSFCNWFESIQIATEFLNEVAIKDGKIDCSTQSYDLILGDK